MLKFLRSSATPLPLRTLHLLQTLLVVPSFPLFFICLLGLLVLGFNFIVLVQFPWLLSSFSVFVLLWKERRAAAKGELTRRRYLVLQLLKIAWTALFFAPLVVAHSTMNGVKTNVWVIIHLKKEWEWMMVLWFNGLHWLFIAISFLYGAIFFRGQVEGTIRLRTDEPIGLDVDRSTANDEAIARQLQANEPDWEV